MGASSLRAPGAPGAEGTPGWPRRPVRPALWGSINQFAADGVIASASEQLLGQQMGPSTPRTGSTSEAAAPALQLPDPPCPTPAVQLGSGKKKGKPDRRCGRGGMLRQRGRELPWLKGSDTGVWATFGMLHGRHHARQSICPPLLGDGMQVVTEWAGWPGACHEGRAGAAERGSATPWHCVLHPPFPGTALSGMGEKD